MLIIVVCVIRVVQSALRAGRSSDWRCPLAQHESWTGLGNLLGLSLERDLFVIKVSVIIVSHSKDSTALLAPAVYMFRLLVVVVYQADDFVVVLRPQPCVIRRA
jgi:hypothetical protein